MGFKSKTVSVGTSDTDIYIMGASLAGAVVLGIGNQTGGALTYTLKFYKQSTAATTALITTRSIAANSFVKLEIPFALEAGDKIMMSASATGVVAFCTVTDSASAPVATGWNPRGVYSSSATYAKNDVVSASDGNSYISMLDGNINNDPSSSPTYWMVNALKGASGDYAPGGADVALADGGTGTSLADPDADRLWFWDDSAGAISWLTLTDNLVISGTQLRAIETHGIALSDEITAITTGANKATFSLPYAFTVTSVYATLNTVSSSGIPTVDINESGTTILSTKLTIDASEKTSATAATAAVISDASIAANAEIGFDIDVAGTGAKGLKVFIQGYRT